MDFIKLFNEVIVLAKPATAEGSFAKSMEDKLQDLELDSLDYIMLYMYFGDIYGMSEEQLRSYDVETIKDFKDMLDQHGSKHPESIEDALRGIK